MYTADIFYNNGTTGHDTVNMLYRTPITKQLHTMNLMKGNFL